MENSEPLALPPLANHAALAEVILTAGFGVMMILLILGAAFEIFRKG